MSKNRLDWQRENLICAECGEIRPTYLSSLPCPNTSNLYASIGYDGQIRISEFAVERMQS